MCQNNAALHVCLKLVQVCPLLRKLRLELEKLLLLTLLDSKILTCFLSLRECVTITKHIGLAQIPMPMQREH